MEIKAEREMKDFACLSNMKYGGVYSWLYKLTVCGLSSDLYAEISILLCF